VSRRLLPLIPALLALALPAAPALAGEDPGSPSGDDGSSTLHAAQSCKPGHPVKAWVTGDNIDRVAFFVNGELVNTDRQAGSAGRYRLSMSCSRLDVGANTARAAVSYTSGSSPSGASLRFSVTRLRQASPRFTG
jgi:hypothetical protein